MRAEDRGRTGDAAWILPGLEDRDRLQRVLDGARHTAGDQRLHDAQLEEELSEQVRWLMPRAVERGQRLGSVAVETRNFGVAEKDADGGANLVSIGRGRQVFDRDRRSL